MTSPGNIVYDLDLDKRSTGRLSNVLLKVKNVDTDTLLQTNNISESYTFPYNYGLVNNDWVNYDTTTSELGIETILPIFTLEKIYSIQNYRSYLAIHPNNADDYVINSLSEVDKLY